MNLPLLFYIAGAFVILIAVGLYVAPLLEKLFWEMQEREREQRDERQTRAFMRQQRRERLPSHLGTQGVDLQLEDLRAKGQRGEALKLAQERLRLAHEQGDRTREERYRRYVAEFAEDAPPPAPPLE
jgi:hypothetical protein